MSKHSPTTNPNTGPDGAGAVRRTRLVPCLAAFLLTGLALTVVQLKVRIPMLLPERFWPGAGWVLVGTLACYAAWITSKMLDVRASPVWRRRVWLLFSAVFFGQLVLGLAGWDRFLMTGELHLPIPALIVAGPVYRGGGLFMPILFCSTVLLVGPAWCSHLCYIGSWDHAASRLRKRPVALPSWAPLLRVGLLVVVVSTAAILGLAGAPAALAGTLALGIGLAGVAVMVVWSRKTGTMVHCTVYCPMGLLANLLGKLSPFRIRLLDGCTECGACSMACRYDALTKADIARRRPGLTCTLCGDCLARCHEQQLEYRFAWWQGEGARTAFVTLVASLHAVFLGVARI